MTNTYYPRRVAFTRTSLEIVSIASFVILPPLIVMAIANGLSKSQSYITGAVASFLISLIFSHVFFFCRRTFSSAKLPQYIDYVYLTFGLFGIVGAVDIGSKIYNINQKENIEFASKMNIAINFYLEDKIKECNEKASDECDRARSILANIQNYAEAYKTDLPGTENSEDQKAPQEEIDKETYLSLCAAVYRAYVDKPDPWQSLLIKFLNSYESYYGTKPPYQLDDSFQQSSKLFGIYLIAAAIGVRLCKTSIEVFNWKSK